MEDTNFLGFYYQEDVRTVVKGGGGAAAAFTLKKTVPLSYLIMMFSFQLNKIQILKKDHYKCVNLILIHEVKNKMKGKCSSIYRGLHNF